MSEFVTPPELVKGSLASGEGILCVGLPRTGSMSLATALERLGYNHVHHIMRFLSTTQWKQWGECAHAHYPCLQKPGEKPPGWPQERWDEWLGQFQVITDGAGFLGEHMIRAYPNAKVILVVRPFDRWFKSINDTLIENLYGWGTAFSRYVIDPLAGTYWTTWGLQSLIGGFFRSNNVEEARANALRVYEDHYRTIREIVPPENLLEYKLGEGWEPICKFLGVPADQVPNEPFPHVNESDSINKQFISDFQRHTRWALRNVFRFWLPFVTMYFGYQLAVRMRG